MEEYKLNIARLTEAIQAGLTYRRDGYSNSFRQHVRDSVIPLLSSLLRDTCHEIEQLHDLHKEEENISDSPFQDVVHYTSINVLVSMIQAQATKMQQLSNADSDDPDGQMKVVSEVLPVSSLRLYDTAHVNDPDEGSYFARHLLTSDEHEWLRQNATSHAYVVSFIKPETASELAKDNLVFWRAYGQEGEGCSITFRIPANQVREVFYGQERINSTIEKLIPIRDALIPYSQIVDPDTQQLIRDIFWSHVASIQYLYKSSAYRYEHECRLVVPASQIELDEITYDYILGRGTVGRLRHYCTRKELDITNILTSSSEITIGPCVDDTDDLIPALYVLLRRAGLYGPTITPSAISYRKP